MYIYIYIYMYVYIYVCILLLLLSLFLFIIIIIITILISHKPVATPISAQLKSRRKPRAPLHSAKGGAVETGCSHLYGVIHYFTL